MEGPDRAVEALPDAPGGSVAFKRKTRSSDRSDGEQEGHAERSTRKVSRTDLRGIQEVGGTEGKRSFGARTEEAQAGQVGRRNGKDKDFAKVGGVKSNRSMVRRPRLFFLWFLRIVLGLHTDEAMCASSRMAHEVSWTALAEGKERDWWRVDLEGEMEKLEVRGPCSKSSKR